MFKLIYLILLGALPQLQGQWTQLDPKQIPSSKSLAKITANQYSPTYLSTSEAYNIGTSVTSDISLFIPTVPVVKQNFKTSDKKTAPTSSKLRVPNSQKLGGIGNQMKLLFLNNQINKTISFVANGTVHKGKLLAFRPDYITILKPGSNSNEFFHQYSSLRVDINPNYEVTQLSYEMHIFPDETQANLLVIGTGEIKHLSSLPFNSSSIIISLFNVPIVKQYTAVILPGPSEQYNFIRTQYKISKAQTSGLQKDFLGKAIVVSKIYAQNKAKPFDQSRFTQTKNSEIEISMKPPPYLMVKHTVKQQKLQPSKNQYFAFPSSDKYYEAKMQLLVTNLASQQAPFEFTLQPRHRTFTISYDSDYNADKWQKIDEKTYKLWTRVPSNSKVLLKWNEKADD